MAGDWIPIETDLTTQQKVLVMSGLMSVSPFEIVGRLCHFWSWFTSQHVVDLDDQSGAIVGAYRDGVIDVGATSPEMFNALESVGWLRTGDVGGKPSLIVPRYGSWLAKCSKARKQKAERQRRWREGRREAPTETRTETRKKTSFVARNVDASKRGKVKGKSKKKPPTVPLDEIKYPTDMDTVEVRGAIKTWLEYKRKRGESYKQPAVQIGVLLKEKQFGGDPTQFVNAVSNSIAQNYAGCYSRKDSHGTNQSTVGGVGRVRNVDFSELPTRVAGVDPAD